MALQPGTNRQVPDHSIMDAFNKQTYLGNQFVYVNNGTTGTTSEFPFILLSNPAVTTSGFPANYQSLFVNFNKLICQTAAATATAKIYLNPTVTGAGTAKTPVNLRTGSATTSAGVLTASPSVSSNGTLIGVLNASPGLADMTNILSIIDPGNSILITVTTSSTTTTVASEIVWYSL